MLTSKICMKLRVHDLLKKKGDRGVFSNKKKSFFCKACAVMSWRSVLLVEETVVPGENHRPVVND